MKRLVDGIYRDKNRTIDLRASKYLLPAIYRGIYSSNIKQYIYSYSQPAILSYTPINTRYLHG